MEDVVPAAPGYAALRIASASDRDNRVYVCTATSAAGTINEQIAVRVERGDGGFGDIGQFLALLLRSHLISLIEMEAVSDPRCPWTFATSGTLHMRCRPLS